MHSFFCSRFLQQNISLAHIRRHTHQRANKNYTRKRGRKKISHYQEMAPKNLQLFKDEQTHSALFVCARKNNNKIGTKVGQMFENQIHSSLSDVMGSREMLNITRFMANNKN
jgi:hypothetical protein